MKVNLPVTRNETPFTRGTIVTKTDLKGVITYANDAFVEISGFSREELIGQSQNIVRHPDMPKAAFADLWQTIKAGRSWRGMVKNRCKNGDHYWVDAFIVPVRKNGNTVGYMSVRTPPSREQIDAADKLYSAIGVDGKLPVARRHLSLSMHAKRTILLVTLNLLILVAGLTDTTLMRDGAIALSMLLSIGFIGVHARERGRLRRIVDTFGAMAEGRLDTRLPHNREDDLGQIEGGLAYMQVHIKVIIDDLIQAARLVQDRSEGLQTRMRDTLGRFEQQFEQIRAISGSVEQMSTSISTVADSSGDVAQATRTAHEVAAGSAESMTRSRDETRAVVKTVSEAQETIAALHDAVRNIGTVTDTIREIADQTNLLALNAAIEAARAGEAGRGFAVVADEVRKLAERTSKSTMEINDIVGQITNVTDHAVSAMQAVGERSTQGEIHLAETAASLSNIVDASQTINDRMRDIAETNQQQSGAAQDLAQRMVAISARIEDATREIEAAGRLVNDLFRQAHAMNEVVSHFDNDTPARQPRSTQVTKSPGH
ncbi:methyl-accepting chemotaxis protein [Laribacter hongkongensis]|uniref:methyl-accepting chemotaxis protein n=1 Tax=Laribacter hongkongensis TaxID=168471 RepID=UPI001EFCD868|nr:PAS domain-containing methyl-accepting chemotaxis protein [Laribacter hongkongensis]MCG9055331.1 methyl-accepting chemotaxis protein [Laribacter hongkongensis]